MAGVRPGDVFQNMSGYGLFTGGLGIHYGAERLGCLTIPAGAGNSKRQIKMLRDFKVTVAHIIPSYALHLSSVFKSIEVDPGSLSLRIMLIGAEPHSEEIRQRIEELYGVKAYNSYGLSEMNGPGVAFECPEQTGMHLWEDAYLAEIVDPDTLEPVPVGEVGELVLTTLCREGMPVIRYRTRDLTRFIPGVCPCGRNHRRIDRITGRSDDMIVLKGVNIYPMQVEKVLMSIPEVGQNYLIELEREGFLDQMRVKVEIRDQYFVEDMRTLQALQKKISDLLREEILITAKIDLVEHDSLPKNDGKAVRVMDKRI
jgi:phenylacetate-CoA ligase